MITVEQRNDILSWVVAALRSNEISFPTEARDFQSEDWAFIFEAVPHELRLALWEQMADADRSAILTAMRSDARVQLISQFSGKYINELAQQATPEQLVEFVPDVPKKIARRIIQRLDAEKRQSLYDALEYKDDQIGRYVNHDVIQVSDTDKTQLILERIKVNALPSYTDSLLVVDEGGFYKGLIDLNRLLQSGPEQTVSELLIEDVDFIQAEAELFDGASQVKKSGRSMLPVLEDDGFLLGRFTLKDAVDVFQEHYEAQFSHLGQVNDEDLFAPVSISARRRAVWLGINLFTAFLASAVIGLFEEVLAQVVALAVLMPIVASMGGIAGSQTLTLTIRGLATDQLAMSNVVALGNKEFRIALINGLVWALVVAIGAGYWFGSFGLSLIIAMALVINMVIAAFSGVLIPVTMDKIGIDPALAGSVVLTTVTDVVGFFVFLGAATLLFL